jgi:uncharacterized membrane protein
MVLSTTGESRVRGYLYVLERSLRTFLPRETVSDAVREVESHIRDRAASAQPMPNERDALERILDELGAPLQVARAYSDELAVDEAVTTGRLLPVVRAILRVAGTGIAAFFAAIALLIGYSLAIGFAAIGVLKPIFPGNVGLWFHNGFPIFGAQFPAPEGPGPLGGYWIVPISFALGAAILIVTHRAARSWLQRFRGRFRAALTSVN